MSALVNVFVAVKIKEKKQQEEAVFVSEACELGTEGNQV
jgi:hypothetical protein